MGSQGGGGNTGLDFMGTHKAACWGVHFSAPRVPQAVWGRSAWGDRRAGVVQGGVCWCWEQPARKRFAPKTQMKTVGLFFPPNLSREGAVG